MLNERAGGLGSNPVVSAQSEKEGVSEGIFRGGISGWDSAGGPDVI